MQVEEQEDNTQQAAIKLRDDAQISKLLMLSTSTHPGEAYLQRVESIEINLAL